MNRNITNFAFCVMNFFYFIKKLIWILFLLAMIRNGLWQKKKEKKSLKTAPSIFKEPIESVTESSLKAPYECGSFTV